MGKVESSLKEVEQFKSYKIMTLRNKSPASSLSQLLNYAYGIQLSEKDSILSKNIFGLTQQK